jgi:Putative O-methyltransferase
VPGSFLKVNYSVRPAKSIERKMLSEAFRFLSRFESLNSYQYVGMGSPYFTDFSLFHKSLGIKHMTSIEVMKEYEIRFEFNRPYRCINLLFESSTEALPKLNWDRRTILWLDYDDPGGLKMECLTDISTFCAVARSGSILIVTVDARPGENPEKRLTELDARLGEKVPQDTKNRDLDQLWGTAKVYREIIKNEVDKALSERNSPLTPDQQFCYKQLFNFHYRDSSSALMLTTGGLLYEQKDDYIVKECGFDSLPFVKKAAEPYSIEVPILTLREVRYFDKLLPTLESGGLKGFAIEPEELRRYAEIYRYYPSYVEAEF